MKAQFWSLDLVFAMVIFGFAVSILAYTWFNISAQLSSAYSGAAPIMQLQAQTLAQDLMSPGAPANWQSIVNTGSSQSWGNVSIGIVSSTGSSAISPAKLNALYLMSVTDYQALKLPLGLGFDYFITVATVPSSTSAVTTVIGRDPNANGALTVYTQRISAALNGAPVVVTVEVWTGSTFATG